MGTVHPVHTHMHACALTDGTLEGERDAEEGQDDDGEEAVPVSAVSVKGGDEIRGVVDAIPVVSVKGGDEMRVWWMRMHHPHHRRRRERRRTRGWSRRARRRSP